MMVELLAQDTGPDSAYVLWGALLFAAALVLLLVEVFVPSGGLIGALAGIAVVGSIVAFFRYDPIWGLAAMGLYVLLTPFVLYFVFKIWINSPIAKRMVLGGAEHGGLDESSEEVSVASQLSRAQELQALRALIGSEGTAVSDLRPVGKVRIEGERLDALAESGMIEAGTPVVVTTVYDNQIKVRPR